MKRKSCIASIVQQVIFIAVLAALVFAKGRKWNPDTYPNPKRDVNLCGRHGRASSICDADNIISFKAANRIEGILKEIWAGSDPYVRIPCGEEGYTGYQVCAPIPRLKFTPIEVMIKL